MWKFSIVIVSKLLFVLSVEFVDQETTEDLDLEVGAQVELRDGLKVMVVKQSSRCVKTVDSGDFVSIDYVGRYGDKNGDIFDDTSTKDFPFKFEVGGDRVIEGLDRAVRGMCKGDIREIWVPYRLG